MMARIRSSPVRRPPGSRALAGLAFLASLGVSALAIPDDGALARCTARVQTGVSTNAVALAQRCGTDPGALRRANPGRDLTRPGLLNIPGGQNSVVPEGLRNEVAPRQKMNATRQRPVSGLRKRPAGMRPQSAQNSGYRIRPGDTLAGIAAGRGISVEALLGANPGIEPHRLAVGRRIAIPAQ